MAVLVHTGVDAATRTLLKRCVDDTHVLGLPVRDGPPSDVSHCVCGLPPRRTQKVLLALARGSWVVSAEWLAGCVAAGSVVDPSPFEIHEIPGCRPGRVRGGGALRGLRVTYDATPGSGMERDELQQLLLAAGAQAVDAGGCSRQLRLTDPAGTTWTVAEAALFDALWNGTVLCSPAEAVPTVVPPAVQSVAGGAGAADASETGAAAAAERAPEAAAAGAAGAEAVRAKLFEAGGEAEKENPSGAARRAVPRPVRPGRRPAAEPPAAEVGRPVRQRRGHTSAAAPVLLEAALPHGLQVHLLPADALPTEGEASGTTSGGAFFALDDALRLYRQRLPACNVQVQSSDFLGELVAAGRTVVMRRGGDRVVGAATVVLHGEPRARFAELQLLAVSTGQARRGLGSALLAALEGWLRSRGMRSCVALAGLDCLPFWEKRGYADDVTLSPQQWSVLRDPFGNSRVLIKEL